MEYRLQIFTALFVMSMIYALWKGGSPERVAAAVLITGSLATILFQSSPSQRFNDFEFGIFVADLLVFAGFVLLSLNAERYWPIWMCALQAIQTISHLADAFLVITDPLVYQILTALWVYPMLLLLVTATWRHQQRIRLHGKDNCWSSFSASYP